MERAEERKDRGSTELANYMSLQDRVYCLIRDWILDGTLKPGDALNTSRLSEQLHVSRTPIREAVNRLVASGLVVKTVHKEARVADFMSEEMREISSARAALEEIAAQSAARYMSWEDKEKLQSLANRCEECYLLGEADAFLEADKTFHFFIYGSLKTAILRDTAERLYMIYFRNSRLGYQLAGRQAKVVEEHLALARAIREGNASLAGQIGASHHHNTIKELEEQLKRVREESKQCRR